MKNRMEKKIITPVPKIRDDLKVHNLLDGAKIATNNIAEKNSFKLLPIKEENTEGSDNLSFSHEEKVKQQCENLANSVAIGNDGSSRSIIKEEVDMMVFEGENFLLEDPLNTYSLKYLSADQTNTLVKMESHGTLAEVEKIDENTVDEYIIKQEELDIKSEEGEENINSSSSMYFVHEQKEEVPIPSLYSIPKEMYTHFRLHEEMYKCSKCKFRTKYQGSLRSHLLRHKTPEAGTAVSESNLIIVEENPQSLEAQEHLKELSTSLKSRTRSFAAKKQRVLRLLEELKHKVRYMTSEEELDVIEKALVSIKYMLAALKDTKGVAPKSNKNEPQEKSITKRKFVPTRKKAGSGKRKKTLQEA